MIMLLSIWMFFLFVFLPLAGPKGELSWYFIPGEALFIISTLSVITFHVCRLQGTFRISFSRNELIVWILFLLSALLSSFNALHHFPSVHGFLVYTFIGISVMLLRNSSGSDQFTKTYSLSALSGSMFISITYLFITAFSLLEHIPFADRTPILISSFDIFGNREYLAAAIGMSLVVFFFSPIRRNGGEFIVYGIIGITLLLLNVRGVIAAASGALLITKLLTTESLTIRKYLVAAIVLLSLILIVFITLSLLQFTIPMLRLHTISGRVLLWIMSIPMIIDSAGTGIGLGNIEFHVIPSLVSLFSRDYLTPFSSSASMIRRIHNEYLDFIVEGGVLLGVSLALILIVTYKRIRKKTPGISLDTTSAIAGILYVLLLSLWSSPLHNIQVIFLSGCCMAQLLGNRFAQSDPVFSLGISKAVSRVLSSMLLLCSVVYFCIIIFSNSNHEEAIRQLSNRSYSDAITMIDKIPSLIRSSDQIYTGIVAKASLWKIDNAKQDCEMLIKKGATIDIMKVYGSLLFDTKEYAKAQGIYQTLHIAFPDQITPLYMLGRIAFEKSDLYGAEKWFTKIFTRKPRSIKAQSEIAGAEEYLRKIDLLKNAPKTWIEKVP